MLGFSFEILGISKICDNHIPYMQLLFYFMFTQPFYFMFMWLSMLIQLFVFKQPFMFMQRFLYSCRIFMFRSIRPTVFCKKGVLKNFAKFKGKHSCQSLLFNNVASFRPTTLLKKRLWNRSFPANIWNVFKKSFFIEHFWWLLRYAHVAVLYSAFFVLM